MTDNVQTNQTPESTVRNHSGFGRLCLLIFAVVVLLVLQNNYWHGENGRDTVVNIKTELAEQKTMNELQQRKNNALAADVRDLKSGLSATEEHARLDLGLIKSGETFVQLSTANTLYTHAPQNDDTTEAVEVVDPIMTDEPLDDTVNEP